MLLSEILMMVIAMPLLVQLANISRAMSVTEAQMKELQEKSEEQ